MGWFAFLINHWVRPYLPVIYPDRRVTGLDFGDGPNRFTKGEARYFDRDGRVYKTHLPQMCANIQAASSGVIDRLIRIYDRIYIDEVQDLCGYDLEVLQVLMDSSLEIVMVGDVRQALLATNPRESKNHKYMFSNIHLWFEERRTRGELTVTHSNESWRCNQSICDFADSIFGPDWNFPLTKSRNFAVTPHDGVRVVAPGDVAAYVKGLDPLCLRYNRSCGVDLALDFMNFGESKGMTVDHVLIKCTSPIQEFLRRGTLLDGRSACAFYVAVTRARSSVGLILDPKHAGSLPVWKP